MMGQDHLAAANPYREPPAPSAGCDRGSPRKVAIIGGGIAGLAAAHRLIEISRQSGPACEPALFDAAPRLGGVIDTRRIGDYLVEAGPDAFITNKPGGAALCQRLGIEDRLLPTDERYRRSLVVHRGQPVPVPEGFLLLAPARVWPVLRSPLFSVRGKLRMGLEYIVPRRWQNGDESLASFVRRRFGREALDRLVQPLVGGIYTSDPEKLSLAATMPRFLDMERQHRSLIRASRKQARSRAAVEDTASGARYGLFAAPAGGMRELVDALERVIRAAGTIRTGTRVLSLEPAAIAGTGAEPRTARWTLRIGEGSAETTESFDAVILALPAWRSAELVAGFDPELAAALRSIEYASSAIVVSGHRLEDVADPLNASGLVVPAVERRRILAVSFASRKFRDRAPEGRVILRTFIGGALQPELLAHSDDELLEIVRSELADLLGVHGCADFAFVARYERAMPQYHVGHLDRVAAIERTRPKHPGLALAGNAYSGVGIPDCIHSGEQAAEAVSEWRGTPLMSQA